jgi:N-carbamoylputrescine amidase
MSISVKIAVIQHTCSTSVQDNHNKAVRLIEEAALQGANIICLQELYNAQYFPQQVNVQHYQLAETIESIASKGFGQLAKNLGVVIILPIYEEAMPGVYFNTALVYDADGSYLGKYRKNHIPDGPQYLEKYYFTPGDMGYPVFNTRYGCIAIGICWDEWFPEVARIFALQGARIIFYPSAIGSEPDRPDYNSSEAWTTVIRSHGITNGVFIAAPNRVGVEADMSFYGQSFISDPFGTVLAVAGDKEQIIYATCEMNKIREARELLQFIRDRRPDTYAPLLKQTV